jgi:hypothetical protein
LGWGIEPALMAAFQDIVSRHQPYFLIELLEGTSEALEQLDFWAAMNATSLNRIGSRSLQIAIGCLGAPGRSSATQ